MSHYRAPLRDMQFVLHELLGVREQLNQLPPWAELDNNLMDSVLQEAGRFCEEEIAPLNRSGDEEGCRLESGRVRTPTGFRQAYRTFAQGGWCGLTASEKYGGQGLPGSIDILVNEMMGSANLSFADYIGLIAGAFTAIERFADEDLRAIYLPRLASGEWGATMCMTEPHCGTDVGMLRTQAIPQADGSHAISGTKIFISGGDHDLTDNIVHLVLARLPDAPPGVRGISLFLVPKRLPDAAGEAGETNAVRAVRLEHKMGYCASATCQMEFEGARGWRLAEPHRGLWAMFVMVNHTRLLTAVQGLSTAEGAYQYAVRYARERIQGRALTGPAQPDKPADPLIVHPDVRRMLLKSRAFIEGARALAVWAALLLDQEHHHPDEAVRETAADLVSLLTPVFKAFFTDSGFESCNDSMQIFGGHGYIRETGVEQFVRDCRIAQIQEGANGIQALDLMGRKLTMNDGRAYKRFVAMVNATIEQQNGNPALHEFAQPLAQALARLEQCTEWISEASARDANEMGAAGVDYLNVFGFTTFAWMWARMAETALPKQSQHAFYMTKLATARFYFLRMLPMMEGHARAMEGGAGAMMDLPEEAF